MSKSDSEMRAEEAIDERVRHMTADELLQELPPKDSQSYREDLEEAVFCYLLEQWHSGPEMDDNTGD